MTEAATDRATALSTAAALARTLRTVRHLRPGQIAHRIRYRLRRARWQRNSAAVDARYAERAAQLHALRWDHPGLARVAAFRIAARAEHAALAAADAALAGRFEFHGRALEFGERVDWFRPDLDVGTRLWKTGLHEWSYAEDLARAVRASGDARYRDRLFDLVLQWRAAAPIGCRDFALDAWNARAAATRLVHWAVAGQILGLRSGNAHADALGREIGRHGLFVRDNLELDLRGNHLFRDVVGLVFANELVGGIGDALAWLEREVAEQMLPDGCHIERAPFYHALCTRDLLEVRLLLGDASPRWLDDALARATGFLAAVALGDGEIPLLGDGWLGEVAVPPLLAAARELVAPIAPEAPERGAGLAPLCGGRWRAVVRVGPHAPDEQMGHAHADLLSFDASFGADRVVTDTGTLLYDPGPDRQRIRSTAAHNTLRLDREEQIEAWSSFRVGRRGRARVAARGRTGTWDWVSASHDAYAFLPGRPMHHRLVAVGDAGILVLDAVLGSGLHTIESHLHEHPDNESARARITPLRGAAEIGAAALHERFGAAHPMRRHRIVSDVDLPWIGGWWISPAAVDSDARLDLVGDEISVELQTPRFALTWRPQATDAVEAVSLCSASGGSAT